MTYSEIMAGLAKEKTKHGKGAFLRTLPTADRVAFQVLDYERKWGSLDAWFRKLSQNDQDLFFNGVRVVIEPHLER